MIRTWS